MNMKLATITAQAEGRYLSRDEQQQMLDYAQSLPERFRIATQIEQKEDGVLRATVEDIRRKYPNFSKYHDQAWTKCYRDMQLVVRYDVHAMILDDAKYVEDNILYWLRTILAGSHFTPGFVRDAYTFLREHFRRELSSDAFDGIEPYLTRNIEVLSDFPEPATPAV